jgi:hypothetical protein
MPTCLARGDEISYTIIPYEYERPLEEIITKHRTDDTLGYVIHDKDTGLRTFTYTESGNKTVVTDHWSLNLLKEFPYLEKQHSWIVYTCQPEDVSDSFNDLLHIGQTLHIGNWDIWKTEEKTGSVAVITSYEIW